MFPILSRAFLVSFFGVCLITTGRAGWDDVIRDKRHKIVFLGDSNTYAGHYIAYLDGFLRTRYPSELWELINLGLPSETLSGLSEADHPYPRPDVHERIDRVLAKVKPKLVFVCYGMNDGIYSPFTDERFAKYKSGAEKLVAKIEAAGAKAILMTPSPFDARPVAKNLLSKDAPKHSWMKPYEKYDSEVLRRYSDYLLEWRKKGYTVVDAHAAVHRFLKEMRAANPKYVVSGDGIHPNPTGHAVIAFEILREMKSPAEANRLIIDAKSEKLSAEWVMKHSMPTDPRWEKNLDTIEKFTERFNRQVLKVMNLVPGKYAVMEGKQKLAVFTHEQLAEGADLTKQLVDSHADKIGDLLRKKHQFLDLAWLNDVGYRRPGTPKGIPLADAQKKAAALDAELQAIPMQKRQLHLAPLR